MRGYVEAMERAGTDDHDVVMDHLARRSPQLRGHWRDGSVPDHQFCACPTPPESPAARLTEEQFARFVDLGTRFSRRPFTPEEEAEYVPLWELAFPHLAPWRR